MINNVSDLGYVGVTLTYDKSVVNVTVVSNSDFDFVPDLYRRGPGWVLLEGWQGFAGLSGTVKLCDITFEPVGEVGDSSSLELNQVVLEDFWMNPISVRVVINGTIVIIDQMHESFNTGNGTYPSIPGTHSGTITPISNMDTNNLYTYSSNGTGGHIEYFALYEGDTLITSGTWNGYGSDWHNITLNPEVTLLDGHTYIYTIRTGSYPQIIHQSPYNATGGIITCTSFVDINGKRHEGWIPAIRPS